MKTTILLFSLSFCTLFLHCKIENKENHASLVTEKIQISAKADSFFIFENGNWRKLTVTNDSRETKIVEKGEVIPYVFCRGGIWCLGLAKFDSCYRERYAEEVAFFDFSIYGEDTIRAIGTRGHNASFWYGETPAGTKVFNESAEIDFRPQYVSLERSQYTLTIVGSKKVKTVPYLFKDFLCKYIAFPNAPENRRGEGKTREKKVFVCPSMEVEWVLLKIPTCTWGSECLPEPIVPKTNSNDKEENLLPPELATPQKGKPKYKEK